jgi:hypothetical protein
MDRALRRICGFSMWRQLPSESTFSRAFAEFAQRTHARLKDDDGRYVRVRGHSKVMLHLMFGIWALTVAQLM